jgi:hypothetical protein
MKKKKIFEKYKFMFIFINGHYILYKQNNNGIFI